ncbi:hypothetical protein [Corallococcus sp. EGB]|uniref:hypothetical protein n=1 Tax=Corallococcus sp. EGB TaxID=1521117 RepID=UPI001CBB5042|nr:hypothetical protein [Corallococcus sp. EGB]
MARVVLVFTVLGAPSTKENLRLPDSRRELGERDGQANFNALGAQEKLLLG